MNHICRASGVDLRQVIIDVRQISEAHSPVSDNQIYLEVKLYNHNKIIHIIEFLIFNICEIISFKVIKNS